VFVVDRVHGFVEELVVENDPEFEWRDMIRQHRSSNESRQTLLYKLDATVRRQLGKKVRGTRRMGKDILGELSVRSVEVDQQRVGQAAWDTGLITWISHFSQRMICLVPQWSGSTFHFVSAK
jgi:citrate lyase gamma subunit